MKPLLIAAGVLAFQMVLFGGYFTFSTIARGRRSAVVLLAWLLGTVVLSLFSFVAVKAVCHECLTFPSVAVCEGSYAGGAIDVELESNRIGGYIKERHLAGCVLYWHENNRGSN